MKARLFAVLSLIVAIALLLPGGVRFAAAQPPGPAIAEIAVSEKDAGGRIELDGDHMLALRLEANPATGYGWEVVGIDDKVLRQAGAAEFQSPPGTIGVPGTQVMRFEGVTMGETALELVYRRPWEKDARPLKTFSLRVQVAGPYTGARPAPVTAAESPSADDGGKATEALPTAYSACTAASCTPVKDQGSCGSCWAFSTVGVLENLIKIKDGLTKDLSEQYLVSCNSDGWSCSGGWYAHDYHQWKYITGEPGPGSVYEADFPYKASNVACNPPHTHHEKITSWAYVGNDYSVPTTAAIKQALYDYGPLSVAVYVGPAFQAYTGGVFQTNESGSPNHAVILVGWDDTSPGYWIMRNSWGSSWGESGYMRIKYGTSQIGYAASYAVYNSTPSPTPTPIPPTPTPTRTPTPPPGGEKIVNGGFENGTSPWVQYSSGGYQLISTNRPHTGAYGVWMGGYNYASEYIYQTITIPTNGVLTYWWYMTTQETGTTAYDYFYVRLYRTNGTLLKTLRTRSNTASKNAWYQDSLSLSSYAGQTLRIRFSATTDSSLPTSFYVDDVSVK